MAMLATNLYIMMVSTRNTTNIWEWIGLRGGFSIYSGWVTAATILNASFVLKSLGVNDTNVSFLNEEQFGVIILYVAFVIYNLASWIELNPLYGSIYIWVAMGIRYLLLEKKPTYTFILEHVQYIAMAQSLSMTGLVSFYGATALYGVDIGLERGLFYGLQQLVGN